MARKKKPNLEPLVLKLFQPQPRKGDLRRAAILLAAIDCIATQGIEGTNLDNIGKRIGLRRPHIAYYYPEKKELIASAIRLITATAQELTVNRVTRAETPKARFIAVIDAAYEWARSFPNQVSVLHLFYHYCTYDRDYRDLHTQIRKAGQERMYSALEPLLKSARDRAEVKRIVRDVQILVLGQITEQFTTSTGTSLDEQRDRAVENALRLLRAWIR